MTNSFYPSKWRIFSIQVQEPMPPSLLEIKSWQLTIYVELLLKNKLKNIEKHVDIQFPNEQLDVNQAVFV